MKHHVLGQHQHFCDLPGKLIPQIWFCSSIKFHAKHICLLQISHFYDTGLSTWQAQEDVVDKKVTSAQRFMEIRAVVVQSRLLETRKVTECWDVLTTAWNLWSAASPQKNTDICIITLLWFCPIVEEKHINLHQIAWIVPSLDTFEKWHLQLLI